ncbi:uncharacterized protein N7469_009321 [Penicillium citrinum]|uniref:Ubiquitin-conjugating enzyme E2 Z n=1 Tax=Penicillium citrinum TaxID=5077 RepID=A0A9W9NN66_PENCI|nr:uncharacterized protein N7469_009321 [Penicillium citrinum]KAJ5223081.1 hypothetical protein N7469_009321 [Penicillium citrinum]
MADRCALRLMGELNKLQKEEESPAITVHYNEKDITEIWALIIGSPDTPYAYGFYKFAIKVPPEYPAKPPKVTLLTTNQGRTRFGPNLYSCGKVCLSILGTWHGNSGENWSPAQGLESVLLSIQSLLSTDPYYNEPGFERTESSSHSKAVKDYNSKIIHENLRLTVISPLEALLFTGHELPPNEVETEAELVAPWHAGIFDDYIKQRFMWYLASYKQTIKEQSQVIQTQERNGSWKYPDLRQRLDKIEATLMKEIQGWPVQGRQLVIQDAGIAVNLRGQHGQIAAQLNQMTESMVELELVKDNPFLWRLTYFGRPMTTLDGGVLRIKIYISPRHPAEQPRVFLETPVFHINVSPTGALIYLPARAEDMSKHIQGIINVLEEETPAYNPIMIVNPEAAKLFWGTKDERRLYNRKLRNSLTEATE